MDHRRCESIQVKASKSQFIVLFTILLKPETSIMASVNPNSTFDFDCDVVDRVCEVDAPLPHRMEFIFPFRWGQFGRLDLL